MHISLMGGTHIVAWGGGTHIVAGSICNLSILAGWNPQSCGEWALAAGSWQIVG